MKRSQRSQSSPHSVNVQITMSKVTGIKVSAFKNKYWVMVEIVTLDGWFQPTSAASSELEALGSKMSNRGADSITVSSLQRT